MESIDEGEFWQACKDLQTRARSLDLDFQIYEKYPRFLRITKMLTPDKDAASSCCNGFTEDEVDDDAVEEIEDNIVYPAATLQSYISVEYDISYSPSYRVPVLYFRVVHDKLVKDRLDFIYDHLVPPSRSNGMRTIGILGAISQTNHPTLDVPCFFIHPCKTSEAMAALTADRQVSAKEYLQIWIGLIGSAVGLSLPVELAMDRK